MERQTLSTKQSVFGLIYWLFQFLALPLIILQVMVLLDVMPDDAKLNFAYLGINFIVTTCLFSRILLRNFSQVRQSPSLLFRYFGLGFAKYYGATLAINTLILVLFPKYSNLNDATIDQMLRSEPLMMTVAVVILAPVSEELLYRGVIYGFIRKKSKIAAYIVSAFIFAAIHITSYLTIADIPMPIISFVTYLPAGVALAYAYEKSGTLLCPILIHMVSNLMATIAMVMR